MDIETELDLFNEFIEKEFGMGEGYGNISDHILINGKSFHYITLCAGIKEPCTEPPAFETVPIAWDEFLTGFYKYSEGKNGLLYWREKPVLVTTGYGHHFYARLFIADRRNDNEHYWNDSNAQK